jgi:hypothetical protein
VAEGRTQVHTVILSEAQRSRRTRHALTRSSALYHFGKKTADCPDPPSAQDYRSGRTSDKNSFLVCNCVLNTPRIELVTVHEPCFCTPRIIMQRC